MKFTIEGYRGAFRGAIEVDRGRTVLLVGDNGQGKSCFLEAVQNVISANALAAGWHKKDPDLIHGACKEGKITMEHMKGTRVIEYPSCEVRTVSGGGVFADEWSLGLKKLHDLDPKERTAELVELTGAKVTREALAAELQDPKISKNETELLITKALSNGFEVASKYAASRATELKGEFKAVAGVTWGSVQGLTFKPDGWEDFLDSAKPEDLEAAAKQARKDYDEAVGKAAVARKAAEHAGKKDEYAAKLADWETSIEVATQELADARIADQEDITCSGCGLIGRVVQGFLNTVPAPKQKPKNGLVKQIEARLANAQMGIGIAKANFDAALKAGAESVAVAEPTDIAVKTTAKHLTAKQKKTRGIELHYEILAWLKYSEIVSADGLPKKTLLDGIEQLNKDLAVVCEHAGWSQVAINNDLDLTYSGRRYKAHSKSRKYRADVTFQIVWSMIKNQPLVVMDEAEMLNREGRNGLFYALKELRIPALVAMTAYRDRDGKLEVPDLAKVEWGETMLVEEGVAKPLAVVGVPA